MVKYWCKYWCLLIETTEKRHWEIRLRMVGIELFETREICWWICGGLTPATRRGMQTGNDGLVALWAFGWQGYPEEVWETFKTESIAGCCFKFQTFNSICPLQRILELIEPQITEQAGWLNNQAGIGVSTQFVWCEQTI